MDVSLRAPAHPAASARPGGAAAASPSDAPIIILTYPHSGSELLSRSLAATGELACTSGSGVLPLCHETLIVWRQAEGGERPPSALAVSSARAVTTAIITVIQAAAGTRRWCETCFASPATVQSFLQIFPVTQVVCLHRSFRGVLGEAVPEYPWGLAGSPFWAHAASHPGNNVATIAEYWAARTALLLDFEDSCPASSIRIRYEDLVAADKHARELMAWLGLGRASPPLRAPGDEPALPLFAGIGAVASNQVLPQAIPEDMIPPRVAARMRELHARLGYATDTADPPPPARPRSPSR